MTIKLETKYGSRVEPSSDDNPLGLFKNRSAPDSVDGSYLEKYWANTIWTFLNALFFNANMKPNEQEDTTKNCQPYDALLNIIQNQVKIGTQNKWGQAGGSSDAITVTLPMDIQLKNGESIFVRAQYANTTTSPTLKVGNNLPKAIVKGNNTPLAIGDIKGAGYQMHLIFDENFDRWVLLNPALGVTQTDAIPLGSLMYIAQGDGKAKIDGYLLCDNTVHDRAKYQRFVDACPNMILDTGNPSTFKLKDMRGYFLRTLDNGSGVDVGRKMASLQGDAIRNITGRFSIIGQEANKLPADGALFTRAEGSGRGTDGGDWGGNWVNFDTKKAGLPTASENRPKNYAFPLYVYVGV